MNQSKKYTINCKGQLVNFSQPKVMGILNITPDSFYDGGKNNSHQKALEQAKTMLDQGATFLDIGGYSSRPNAKEVSLAEEIDRVIPVIERLVGEFPEAYISIDTFRSQVAREAVKAGACIVNDISAGDLDSDMLSTVGKLGVPYIMMHMRGTPQTMQTKTDYTDLISQVLQYFSKKIKNAYQAGINDLIVDPGFGFAKTTAQNFELLAQLSSFELLELPVLAGLSRKSMIYKTLETTAQEALNGTTALNMVALQQGAAILRVHDVKEAVECIKLHLALNPAKA